MKRITFSELERNLDYYLILSEKEDIFVEKDGEDISVLTNPDKHRLNLLKSLKGSLGKVDENINYDEVLGDAILEKHMPKK